MTPFFVTFLKKAPRSSSLPAVVSTKYVVSSKYSSWYFWRRRLVLVAAQLFPIAAYAEPGHSELEGPTELESHSEPKTSEPLPLVPTSEMSAKSPEPSWDTGLLLGVCGVGEERAWEVTKFCLGGLFDVMFLRKQENETGIGAYAALSTAGFRDVRASGGITSIFSLIDWFSLTARVGGLGVFTPEGVQPGFEGYLGIGQRSVSLRSHYALSHSFFAGLQYALPSAELPASHAIWLGFQLDGVWFTAPLGLFR